MGIDMKKILIIFQLGIVIFVNSCSSSFVSSQNSKYPNSPNIDKWKKSTINIECATDSKSYNEQIKIMEDNFDKLKRGEINPESLTTYYGKDIRFQGTALYVEYQNKKFLVTARHVLHDTLNARRYIESELDWNARAKINLSNDELKRIINNSQKEIFSNIFRVQSLDEFISNKGSLTISENLMNLGAGGYDNSSYTFSEPEIDLAVISLKRETIFIKDLETNGYRAVTLDSIWNYPLKEGDDLFCIGYPVTTSPIIKLNQPQAIKNWSSSTISLPTFSFGKVAMNNKLLTFFLGDLSIYPGNSGGPAINNDNLVGIVSAQPLFKNQNIPFAYIIKIDFLKTLLDEQIKKDNKY